MQVIAATDSNNIQVETKDAGTILIGDADTTSMSQANYEAVLTSLDTANEKW